MRVLPCGGQRDYFAERVIGSCRAREPSVAGILVHGSYANARSRSLSPLARPALKVRCSALRGDEVGARLEAQAAARFAAPTVCALNDPEPVTDPRSALAAVLAFPIAPPGWTVDLPVSMGLAIAALDQTVEATIRLVTGTLRLARERNPGVDRQPEIERYLVDGTFERLLG